VDFPPRLSRVEGSQLSRRDHDLTRDFSPTTGTCKPKPIWKSVGYSHHWEETCRGDQRSEQTSQTKSIAANFLGISRVTAGACLPSRRWYEHSREPSAVLSGLPWFAVAGAPKRTKLRHQTADPVVWRCRLVSRSLTKPDTFRPDSTAKGYSVLTSQTILGPDPTRKLLGVQGNRRNRSGHATP